MGFYLHGAKLFPQVFFISQEKSPVTVGTVGIQTYECFRTIFFSAILWG